MSDEDEKKAIKHYNDPKKGYWGKSKMMKKYRKVLKNMYALQRHREIKARMIRKKYRHIKAPRPFYSVQCDLAFWDRHAKQNSGVIGLLVVIDVFSRYLWVKKIYNKGALHVGLRSVIERMKSEFDQTPLNMTADNEFATTKLQALAANFDFKWYFSDTGEKYRTGVVERVIRTIRNLIKRYQAQNNTTRYIDVLDDLVENYNNTEHRTINTKPIDAIKTGKIYDKREPNDIGEINTGQKVRIQELRKKKNTFVKGDAPYYSKDVFRIAGRDGYRYILKDDEGNIIPKRYGRSQLYKIDKVVGQQNKNKRIGYDEQNEKNVKVKKNKNALKRMGIDIQNMLNKEDRDQAEVDLGFKEPHEIQRMDRIDDEISREKNPKKKKQLEKKKDKQHPSVPLPQPSIPKPSSNERVRQLQNQIEMYKRSSRPSAAKIIKRIEKQIDEIKNPKKKKFEKLPPLPPIPENVKLPPLPLPSEPSSQQRNLPPLPPLPSKPQPLRRSSRQRKAPDRYKPIDFRKPKRKKKSKKKQHTTDEIAQHMSKNMPKFSIGKMNAIKNKRKKHRKKK